jgi:hypothetical protein
MLKKLKVTQERHYSAHQSLIKVASNILLAAKSQERFCSDGDFIALIMSALAIEALCNTVGSHIFDDWNDFDTMSPKAKIRLICEKLKVSYNKNSEPFKTLHSLILFRNKIAHAKPEYLRDESMMTREAFEATKSTGGPQSKIEAMISIEAAQKAVDAVRTLEDMLTEQLSEEIKCRICLDSWEMSAERDS